MSPSTSSPVPRHVVRIASGQNANDDVSFDEEENDIPIEEAAND